MTHLPVTSYVQTSCEQQIVLVHKFFGAIIEAMHTTGKHYLNDSVLYTISKLFYGILNRCAVPIDIPGYPHYMLGITG